jgi:hypothetical protein
MKTKTIIIILISSAFNSMGQSTSVLKLFNNLPIDRTAIELNDLLKKDTLKYKLLSTKGIDHYYYSVVNPDSLFNLVLSKSVISISNYIPEGDSVIRPKIDNIIYLNKRKNSSKKVSLVYNKLVDQFNKKFQYSKPTYIKGFRTENGKQSKVDEWSTYFYNKQGEHNYKFSIVWFDEGKHGHVLMFAYKLD